MSEFKNLTLEVADGIAVLAISRPAALNALNSETLDELNVCLSEIEANDDIKAVILTGGGQEGQRVQVIRSWCRHCRDGKLHSSGSTCIRNQGF